MSNDNEIIVDLKKQIEELEKTLVKQKKITNALKNRVKDNLNSTGSNFSIFQKNILLENETERRTKNLLELKEKAEQENVEKSDFFSSMSHELRSPMHAILSYAKLGMKKYDSVNKERIKKYFDSINISGGRLLRLIDDLLDLAKLESGKFEINVRNNNLYKVSEGIIKENEELLNTNKITVNLINDNAPEISEFDTDRASQIIQNLLSNAIKFSPQDTKITVRCSAEILDDSPAIQLSIIDQGPGIPEGETHLVFEKYVQSSLNKKEKGGTGLGLSICKELVHLHNGKIWAENNPEKGACFSFIFPLKHIVESES